MPLSMDESRHPHAVDELPRGESITTREACDTASTSACSSCEARSISPPSSRMTVCRSLVAFDFKLLRELTERPPNPVQVNAGSPRDRELFGDACANKFMGAKPTEHGERLTVRALALHVSVRGYEAARFC